MFKLFTLIAIVLSIGFSGSVAAQDATQRTKDLVAALDKTKYKKKEKANVSIEVFVDIKNEAVTKNDRSEYSGLYEVDGYKLDLRVANDGSAASSGFDSSANGDKPVNFTLKNAKIDGALLTATKVYDNGKEQPLEAVFVNRNARAGSNPKVVSVDVTQFGLGFIQPGSDANDNWTNRVFLEKK